MEGLIMTELLVMIVTSLCPVRKLTPETRISLF